MAGKTKHEDPLYNKIKTYLSQQGYHPGDRVEPEIKLAKRFGVSRHQVRNALTTLSELGILKRFPRRGTIINGFDADSLSEHIKFQFGMANFDIAEFKEARVVVERAIIPMAVRRISPLQLAKLEEAVQQMLQNADNPKEADKFDRSFHVLLLEACGNNVLKAFSGVISTLFHSKDYRKKYWRTEHIKRLAKEHASILEAVRKGDPDLATKRLEDHLGYTKLGILT
jgi:GntR family galactonate operon transcriptional repressor